MKQSLLFLAALAFTAAAKDDSQDKTVEVLLPGLNVDGIVGSVVGVKSSKTTYTLTCAATITGACWMIEPYTVTQGPSTLQMSMHSGKMHNTVDCSLDGTRSASCAGTMSGTDDDGHVVNTVGVEHITGTDMIPSTVTITAGAEKLTDVPSASAGATGTAETGKATGTTSGPAETGSGTAASSAPATSSSEGAGPVVTAGAWALGVAGAAALAAL